MAKTPKAVRRLLMDVWRPARARARKERDVLQKTIAAAGGNFRLAPWDWRYYAEKVRKEKFDIDEGLIKPYLQLENVIAAAFDVAQRLFGIVATERKDLSLYHPTRPVSPFRPRSSNASRSPAISIKVFRPSNTWHPPSSISSCMSYKIRRP
jgi:Zn-dependent oligopeptidase